MLSRMLLFLLLTGPLQLAAQDFVDVDYERVLVPVPATDEEVPGAFGSRWKTVAAISNTSDQRAFILGYTWIVTNCPTLCTTPSTPAGVTFFPEIVTIPGWPAGLLLIERRLSSAVHVQVHVRDVSRQSEGWGTEIPTVRESEFRAARFSLLNVPLDAGYRIALRIYELGATEGSQVRVRTFAVNRAIRTPIDPMSFPSPSDALLSDQVVTLTVYRRPDPVFEAMTSFSHATVIDFAGAESSGAEVIRIEVEPVTPNLRLWAFVTVTNNVTQQFTTVTPR